MKISTFYCDLCNERSETTDSFPIGWNAITLREDNSPWEIHVCYACKMLHGKPEELETKEGGKSLISAFLKNAYMRRKG